MNKTYVVNGAAHSGFGETTARMILDNGDKVIGLYEDEDQDNADKMLKEFDSSKLQMLRINSNDLYQLKKVVVSIDDELDGFVNACFMFEMDNLNEYDFELSERIFRANYQTPMVLSVELKKKMKKEASIVIVTSTESERGSFGGVSYAATKAAMHNMIKSLACNWGKKEQIRVNAVAAGWIGGEMDTDGPFAISIDITPLGRLGRPEEVASTVCFLLSKKASFINAQTIFVDGGYLCVDDIAKFEYEESKRQEI